MQWVLWLNTVGETVIAIGMFSMPATFFPGAAGLSAAIARAFAFAILAVAYISFSVTGRDVPPAAVRHAIRILIVYHLLQLLAQFVNAAMFPPMLLPPVFIHIVYSTLFITYARRLRGTAGTASSARA